jgi:hypothetical protein
MSLGVNTIKNLKEEAQADTRVGSEFRLEHYIERYLGNSIHLFLSVLAFIIFIAAVIASVDTVIRDFPRLWQQGDEYTALQKIIDNILLIAIAAEFALLLIFHRTTAAVEVIIVLIARKMISPTITMLDLLIGVLAIAAMVIMRKQFLSEKS